MSDKGGKEGAEWASIEDVKEKFSNWKNAGISQSSGMYMFTFAHPGSGEIRVPRIFWSKIGLLQRRPELVANGRYTITSDVDRDVVDLFFARVMGDDTAIARAESAEQLRALCDELGFVDFDNELGAVLRGDWNLRKDLDDLRGRFDKQEVIIEELQRCVLSLKRQLKFQWGHREMVEAAERFVPEIRKHEVPYEAIEENRNDVEGAVAEAQREVSGRASTADVAALSEHVARFEEAEAEPVQSPGATREAPMTVQVRGIEFAYDPFSLRRFDGIIAHLTREYGGNVHVKGVVTVIASSCMRGLPGNVVDFESDSYFASERAPNSWIRYDFGGQRVTPTSYSIMSYPGSSQRAHPKSWALEVSNDGSEGSWMIVDSREDNFDLNYRYIPRHFAIRAPPSGAFRFVRLRQTGTNHNGHDCLIISALELFGTLFKE